jgi:hypothetical protein
MICERAVMQLSAANILQAAQQGARQPQPAKASPAFASELSATQSRDEGFAPLAFKQTAEPAVQARPAQTAPSRPGATLDIKI